MINLIGTFFKDEPTPVSFCLFLSFCTENFSSQQDSNSDHRSRRRGRWPLDHHLGQLSVESWNVKQHILNFYVAHCISKNSCEYFPSLQQLEIMNFRQYSWTRSMVCSYEFEWSHWLKRSMEMFGLHSKKPLELKYSLNFFVLELCLLKTFFNIKAKVLRRSICKSARLEQI